MILMRRLVPGQLFGAVGLGLQVGGRLARRVRQFLRRLNELFCLGERLVRLVEILLQRGLLRAATPRRSGWRLRVPFPRS